MNPTEAGYYTLREIQLTLEGYRKKEERLMRRDWEVARWQIMSFLSPHSKKNLRLYDIARFDWERTEFIKPDADSVFEKYRKMKKADGQHT